MTHTRKRGRPPIRTGKSRAAIGEACERAHFAEYKRRGVRPYGIRDKIISRVARAHCVTPRFAEECWKEVRQ